MTAVDIVWNANRNPTTTFITAVYDLGGTTIKLARLNVWLTGFYPSLKTFWSCSHVISYQNYTLYINLHLLLNILVKATLNIQESRKSIKFLKR